MFKFYIVLETQATTCGKFQNFKRFDFFKLLKLNLNLKVILLKFELKINTAYVMKFLYNI